MKDLKNHYTVEMGVIIIGEYKRKVDLKIYKNEEGENIWSEN